MDQFERTTTNIRYETVRFGQSAQYAPGGIIRLFSPFQNTNGHTRHPCTDGRHEIRTIGRIPHRRGGQNLKRLCSHGTGYRMKTSQHVHRQRNAFVIQASRCIQTAPQLERNFLIEDGERIARNAFKNHEPD